MRRQYFIVLIVLAATAILVEARLLAHHAFASEFDQNAPIALQGTLTKMEWVNPHAWLHLEVKDPKTGKITSWAIEAGGPNNLLRRGFTKNMIPIGDEIYVEGYRAKDPTALRANGHILETVKDGKAFFLGSSGTGAPYEGQQGVEYDINGRPILQKNKK